VQPFPKPFPKHAPQSSTPARVMRAIAGSGILVLITACGSGGGDSASTFTEAKPVQLGAALPEEGNFFAITQTLISQPESSRIGRIELGSG